MAKYVSVVNESHSFSNESEWYDFSDDVCYTTPVTLHKDLTQIDAVLYSLTAVYILIILLSVWGNAMVIWTVWKNTHMHTVTNYYIVNLAVSDLLVTGVVMPLKLLEYTSPCHWHVFRSNGPCFLVYYLLPIFVFASVLTLVAISMERFNAIVRPLDAMKITSKSRTRKILLLTWIIPAVLASPYIYCRNYTFTIVSELGMISRQICTDRFQEIDVMMYGIDALNSGAFRRGFFIFLFVVVYLIPLIIITTSCVSIAVCLLRPIVAEAERPPSIRKHTYRRHEENKRKVARMVVVIAFAFIISWTPFYLTSIISQLQEHSFLKESNFVFTMLMTHLCGFLNSCVNPFIYFAMSKKFRRSFKQIMRNVFCHCVISAFRRNRGNNSLRSVVEGLTYGQSMSEAPNGNDMRLNVVSPMHHGSRRSYDRDNLLHESRSSSSEQARGRQKSSSRDKSNSDVPAKETVRSCIGFVDKKATDEEATRLLRQRSSSSNTDDVPEIILRVEEIDLNIVQSDLSLLADGEETYPECDQHREPINVAHRKEPISMETINRVPVGSDVIAFQKDYGKLTSNATADSLIYCNSPDCIKTNGMLPIDRGTRHAMS